jgi:hypothetical protein
MKPTALSVTLDSGARGGVQALAVRVARVHIETWDMETGGVARVTARVGERVEAVKEKGRLQFWEWGCEWERGCKW